MLAEQHIVQKVIVDVDVNSIELAEKIKSEINDFIQNEVLSIVEAYFDELNLPDELSNKVIQLDRVDLSVDAATWKSGSAELKQAVRVEVEKQMNPIIEKVKEKQLKRDLSLPKGFDAVEENKANVYSTEERVLRSMFYFLDNGILPWWVKSVEDSRDLFTQDSLMTVLQEQPVLANKEFQKRRGDQGFRKRLVQQFPISVIIGMIQNSLNGRKEAAQQGRVSKAVLKELKRLPKSVSNKTLDLLVELSDPNIIDEVFKKRSSSKLFKHIHAVFFDANLSEKQLESTLITTISVLRVLHFLSAKENAVDHIKSDFHESLNQELESETLALLKKSKAYQKFFLTQHTEEGNEASSPKSASKKENKTLENVESTTESEQLAADSIKEEEKHKAALDIENSEEGKSDEILGRESTESVSDSREDQSPIEESSIEVKEDAEVRDAEIKLNEERNESSQNNEPREAEVSDQKSDLESDEAELRNVPKSDKESPESTSGEDTNEITSNEYERGEEAQKSQESNVSENSESNSQRNSEESKLEQTQSTNLELEAKNDAPSIKQDEASEVMGSTSEIDEKEREELSEILRKRTEQLSNTKKKERSMPNELFVENAGLVLLNPFLPALFKQLELVGKDGKLINPELAACVLHYAATGREGDFEFEMTFEKYLCGIPPTVSINKELRLTEKHKKEVANVLNSVLEHWSALKSKSTVLLQNEFLARSGKLIVEKSNHRLIIEKKTFDLLLDKLPWSYSLIKFSWKKDLMFVEW